jgi:hypothetical protein
LASRTGRAFENPDRHLERLHTMPTLPVGSFGFGAFRIPNLTLIDTLSPEVRDLPSDSNQATLKAGSSNHDLGHGSTARPCGAETLDWGMKCVSPVPDTCLGDPCTLLVRLTLPLRMLLHFDPAPSPIANS